MIILIFKKLLEILYIEWQMLTLVKKKGHALSLKVIKLYFNIEKSKRMHYFYIYFKEH